MNTLIHNNKIEHVFYYEFLLGEHKQPSCSEFDDALYVPSNDPNAPDRPRPAASWIFDNKGEPWGYTGGTGAVYKRYAYLEGSVYPGGVLNANYYFQYGTSPGTKSGKSGEGSAGSGIEDTSANMGVEGLTPDTTYYYRIVAVNSEGEDAGIEKSFTTESAPPLVTTESPREITRTTATFEGQVDPDGLSTEYYFEYNEVGGGEHRTERVSVGSEETYHRESKAVSGLKSCTRYQVQIEAENADPPKPASGGVKEFEMECWPPQVISGEAKEVKRTSAVLQGEVYPNGLPTKYWFEYGKKGAYEAKTEISEGGSSKAWETVHATATGEPCYEYQWRIVAENEDSRNSGKGVVDGEPKYFETKCKPKIQGVKISELKPGSIVLSAEVNPEEAEATYHFEYGTTEAYGTSVPTHAASIGSGAAFVKVSDAVIGLVPGQTYYFRAAAKNVSGETTSTGQSFRPTNDWETNSKLVTTTALVKATGTLLIESGGAMVECTVEGTGEALPGGLGKITKVTGVRGEVSVPCRLVRESGGCLKSPEVEATDLPWSTELVDEPVKNEKGEVVRYEVRDRFYGASSSEPGWVLTCKSFKETCVGEWSGNVENVTAGVPVEFDAKSKRLTCGGTEGRGGLEGSGLVFASSTEGSTLSIYGAPTGPLPPTVATSEAKSVTSSGATLAGTVAAKGVASTYQFEYGTSTSYGSKIPASPASAGEGRDRVEYTQSLTGLEPGVLYHYRIAATNSAGTSYGVDKTFTTGYPAKWYVNGSRAEDQPIKASGTLLVESGGAIVECTVDATGEAGTAGSKEATVRKVTGVRGEVSVPCRLVRESGGCLKSPEVEATDLPWSTELVDEPVKNEKGEVVRYEVRDRFYGASSSEPGWVLTCKSFKETCVGEWSGNVENVTAGVPVEFDAKSKRLTCGGTEGRGGLEGSGLVFASSTEGSTLSIYGAPTGPLPPTVATSEAKSVTSSGATLAGTVAAKGVASTYQFEYGTSTSYGSKIPASPASAGEGRDRVEYTQSLTGLEPGVLYHYRIAATNSAGTSYGVDKTFTTGYPAKWYVNGSRAEDQPIKASGTLLVESGGAIVECTVDATGEAGTAGSKEATVRKVTGVRGEVSVPCRLVRESGGCLKSPEVEATDLPWSTELVDEPVKNEKGEVVRYEVRDRFYGASSSEPGWVLTCKSFKETCVGEWSGNVENVTAGVPVEFDAKSKRLTCGGTEGRGGLEGSGLVFASSTEGSTLSIYGAPTGPLPPTVATSEAKSVTSSGATLAGTVAAKGVASTYQFEYGTSTSYGSKIPASPASAGEGRDRVEYTQSLTGLEPGVLYHYRIAATNSAGTSYGVDKTFTTGYPAKWYVNGSRAEDQPIKASGTLLVESGGAIVECTVDATGEAGTAGSKEATVRKVTGVRGEVSVPCRLVRESGGCLKSPEVEATDLPWSTELVDEPVKNEKGEVVRYEVRDRFYGASSSEPGWVLTCKSFKETCVGEWSGNVENVTAGVPVEFDAKSKRLTCGGTEGRGGLEGSGLVFASSTEGSTLSIYGAPTGPLPPTVATSEAKSVTSSGATLAGTVAAKGVASTYQFEYGTSTSYGSKIPASPASAGEGRDRVEYTQSLTGLEPGVLYHYRIAATNSAGTSYGVDKTFTTGYPAKWYVNGSHAENKPIKSEGPLILEDPGLGTVECIVAVTGEVGVGSQAVMSQISKVTGTKGETQLNCRTIKQSWCGEAPITVEAVNLPWTAELIDEPIKNEKGEVTRYETRNRLYGTSEDEPGWVLKCEFLGSTATDTCLGEPSGNVENVTAGVPVEFDARSKRLTCSGSLEKGAGTMEGVLMLTSTTEGSTLSVYGAQTGPLPPNVVTRETSGVTNSDATLNGTVGAKDLKTEYHFEYGTTTSYGTSIPIPEGKAGEGRTRLEVSQAVTGLQASTFYHYRLVAKNSAGTTHGEDETFTTK